MEAYSSSSNEFDSNSAFISKMVNNLGIGIDFMRGQFIDNIETSLRNIDFER